MAPPRRRQGPAHHRGPALPALPLLALLLLACGDDPPTTPDPVAATIEILSGDAQRAVQDLPLEERIAVRVLDDANRPLSSAAITFTPSSGGQADSASVATDDGGRATAIWVLGPDPGEQTLTVSSGAASARVTAESLDLEAELDLLFVPATQAEMDVVLADWAGRSAPAEDLRVELSEDFSLGGSDANLRVVSHVVSGYRHYGVIITPAGAEDESLPILVYLHGGESGVSTADAQIAALGLGEDLRESFVYVLPSYRSEPLRHGETQWVSEGTSSHWDYDVDDVIALVNVAFETTPEAKPGGYNLLGGSRGGGVALLAGIRDERVERIVSFFGPTDFFDTWVREIVREAALRTPRRLTGVAHLDSTIVQPYISGDMPRSEARLELVRRSSVLFAADIPPLQVHHGTIDFVVSVSQAESLIRAMEALGRGPPDFEAYIYESGGHDFLSLEEAIPRAVAFLSQALGQPPA
ncbi:MAG: hypothetical protein OXF01_08715 [Gemmatimonadetes bacterium]|nr:hypothetical protein [Gemmatimonadota bacterium]